MKAKLIPILVAVVIAAMDLRSQCSATDASKIETFRGMCDASAVLALNDDLFVIADDEDSLMRIYSRSLGGMPLHFRNLTSFLGFTSDDEADIEGSARIGDVLFWITSHGNNRKGKEQVSRQRFFAVKVTGTNQSVQIQPTGRPYAQLLDDMLADPRLKPFNLLAATRLPPKTPGALNIEGLAATPEGHLLIAFRNPVPRGRALIVPLLNPLDVIAGQRAKLGDPMLLDLGGFGVRSIEAWNGHYLIVAGSVDGKGKSRLYEWSGGMVPPQLWADADFTGINAEAIAVMDHGATPELLIVSDDGTRKVNGVECKKLSDPRQKSFRAMVLPLEPQLTVR